MSAALEPEEEVLQSKYIDGEPGEPVLSLIHTAFRDYVEKLDAITAEQPTWPPVPQRRKKR